MPRKGEVSKRRITADPVFGSEVAQRLINKLIKGGKKSVAEGIFYGAMQQIEEAQDRNPLEVLTQALRNTMPTVEVRPRRVGGANYQVPVEVSARRQITLAIRWLVTAARNRPERTMRDRFAREIMDAARREGAGYQRREEVHRMAEANKAYAHYRW